MASRLHTLAGLNALLFRERKNGLGILIPNANGQGKGTVVSTRIVSMIPRVVTSVPRDDDAGILLLLNFLCRKRNGKKIGGKQLRLVLLCYDEKIMDDDPQILMIHNTLNLKIVA